MNNPVIVVGMHRSGTSLLTRILDELGVFVGNKISGNHEAKFFQEINIWLFNQLGGRWDYPPNIEYLTDQRDILEQVIEYISKVMNSSEFVKYIGWKNFLNKKEFTDNIENPWGWKDPRNVYTLPIWLKMFPDARVIYIERHGVDVANSLRKRALSELDDQKKMMSKSNKLHVINSKKFGLSSHSFRCSTLQGGFSLWEEYVLEGRKNIREIRSDNLLSLQYENILDNPSEVLELITNFIGVSANNKVDDLSVNLRSGRANAYKGSDELKEFASQVSTRLKAMGYE